jgi:CHAT domain-containing protein
MVSSYAPSVSSLLRAQKRASASMFSDMRMLLIAEPRAKHIASDLLLAVEQEVRTIQQRLGADSSLSGSTITMSGSTKVADVSAELQRASVVHFACHGIQNSEDALKSAFCLGDGDLTVANIMDLQLQDKLLAFMSACETAKGDRAQPDQTIHLAAAMLHVGFKSVIATMWYVV